MPEDEEQNEFSRHLLRSNELMDKKSRSEPTPLVSRVYPDKTIVELVYQPEEHQTRLCVASYGAWLLEKELSLQGQRFVPYSPDNNLIKNEVVLLPSCPEEYGSEEELLAEIQAYLHRYVDVSPLYEQIASHYVLFSWVYDAFSELPYLRVRGDYGSGKSRFLMIVGSVCYKPIFASGASTVSPLFRILDAFRGTLIIDEGDFRLSDERAEVIKILNQGNSRGFPVLRTDTNRSREFDPRAYHVFGPKLVASRGYFDDRALESRFLTEEMGQHQLREDIPINLTDAYKAEAATLRNKLLLFRLRNLHKVKLDPSLVDLSIEPRLNQIFVPLLSIVHDEHTREELRFLARSYHEEITQDRGMDPEAHVLEIIRQIVKEDDPRMEIKEIASRFAESFGLDYERSITAKWIGSLIRRKLRLKTRKSHGSYSVEPTEIPKLELLWKKYGIGEDDVTVDTAGQNEPLDLPL